MTKSRKRILLSSIAMLLVALVALGSATFAWFTINKVVTADTMKVKAIVGAGLVIDNKQSPTWVEREVSFADSFTSLKPVSIDVTNTNGSTALGTAYYATDVKADQALHTITSTSEASATGFTSVNLPTGNKSGQTLTFNANDYIAAYTVAIKSSGAAIQKAVTAEITLDSNVTTHEANKFVKAALVRDGNVIGFYTDEKYYPIVDNEGTIEAKATTVTDGKASGITAIAGTAQDMVPANDGTPVSYTMYVWYEGNDNDCKDANQTAEASLTLSFTLAS